MSIYLLISRKILRFADGIHSLHCRRTNFRDMTMTRWRERGLDADWLKMAAICLIGLEDFRRQISVGRDAGWREINEALSGAREFCYGKLCLPRLASVCFMRTIKSATDFLRLGVLFT